VTTGVSSQGGLKVSRLFTSAGKHPYSEVKWERSDIVLLNWRDGSVNFEQRGVEFPASWSVSARQIVASKYFRGQLGSDAREWSLQQLIDRVVSTYVSRGVEFGYFNTDEDAIVFSDELTWLLLHQFFAFNSPVWFNVGTRGRQQVSACFLLSVDDTMDSILDWYKEEGLIFKGGSGSGVNLSRIRSSKELMSSGGTASGPASFMRGADSSAGAIKSGGSTRRAAKLVCLDVDHPDILDFVQLKSREEKKIKVLRDAGFDMDLGGDDINSVQYQNANNSVRVSDEFMRAVEDGSGFALRARLDGSVVDTIDARELFRAMAQSAHECADPGIQYDDTINAWHTCPEDGRITTSNPCSEYMHLDNSSCNLASLNLLKFMTKDGGFSFEAFEAAVKLVITAMDISVSFADFPTAKITEVSRRYRQLGIGYCNLGALLMSMGRAYDSVGGRALAGSITSLMSAAAWDQSALLARVVGPYDGYARNADAHRDVVCRHTAATVCADRVGGLDTTLYDRAQALWSHAAELGDVHGYRNAQVSLIAPTGTISFMMDADTTGVEPDFSLVKHKKLAHGGSMEIVNKSVVRALQTLGYEPEQVEAVVDYVAVNGHVVGAPALRWEHYEVFDCAVGERSIASDGHLLMMAAVQPFLCGAISKTINMPEDSTVTDIEAVYLAGWRLGLKSLAVYRDNSKAAQPLSVKKVDDGKLVGGVIQPDLIVSGVIEGSPHVVQPVRQRLPSRRPAETLSFDVGGAGGYLTVGSYPGNGPGEIFLKLGKQGSTLAGLLDAFSISVSIALQYGVPLDVFVEKFVGTQFEPRGMTNDPEIRMATSIMDYVFRRLALDHLSREQRDRLGVLSTVERSEAPSGVAAGLDEVVPVAKGYHQDNPLCSSCGVVMQAAGVCFVCSNCGSTSGCS
jgi:ribonucleoside-diphosphate reductase alpha chain